jgi:hypothetical protein
MAKDRIGKGLDYHHSVQGIECPEGIFKQERGIFRLAFCFILL